MSKTEQLVSFLLEANQAGYASEQAQVEKLPDGLRRIVFESDDWRLEDVWWGGNPFAGQEKIWQADQHIYTCDFLGGVVDL